MTPSIEVQVGKISFTLPTTENQNLISEAVDRVNDLLRQIEEQSDRIDTPRFAVQAAVTLAAECIRLEHQREQDQRDFLKALDHIGTALEKLSDEAPEDPGPGSVITPLPPRNRA